MSIWDKTIAALPPIKDDPLARKNAAYLREWLAYVAANPDQTAAFDAELDAYARQCAQERAAATGKEIAFEGSGYLFLQFTAIYGAKDEYYPELCAQIDRRMAARGLVFCPWRGWITRHEAMEAA